MEMKELSKEEMSPLSSLEVWDEDVLKRYPEPGPAKAKDEFRIYDDAEDNPVREFYRLNHKYQTYGNVLAKKANFLKFDKWKCPGGLQWNI